LFDFQYKYFEWTYLFFLLLSERKRIYFRDALTYRKYEDNPLSISKSVEYGSAYPGFLLKLMALKLEPDVKRGIKAKYLNALNTQANLELSQGRKWRAWQAHLKCLSSGGWRYLAFTRHLLFAR
jgi:hypothetical protein